MIMDIIVGIFALVFFVGLLYINYKDDICNKDCEQGRCCNCRNRKN